MTRVVTYSKVQFIAYCIYTGPGHAPDRYIGTSDEAADVRLRVQWMTEAVNKAGDPGSGVDPRPDVLKVFIAPEFYFRSMYGGYTDMKYFSGEGAGRDPNSIVGGLANAVQAERWNDWLFIFGTSVAVAGPFIPPESSEPRLKDKISVVNVALVQKGGFANEDERTAKAVAIVKEYKSGIDFGDFPGVKFKPDDIGYFPPRPISYASEMNTPGQAKGGGFNGGSIFELDGITFGLEVCADHGMRRLRKAQPLAGDTFVQLQLIPSGGATIMVPSVATMKGGLVFNVDGLDGQTLANPEGGGDKGFHSELYSVTSIGQPSLPSDLKAIPSKTSVEAHADLNGFEKVFWLPPEWGRWVPHLVIYEVADIPAAVLKT